MATFVLIHGAGSDSWYWHLIVPELIARGHDVVAPDLPSDDDSAGLAEYTDAVVDAIGDRTDLVVVAQSLGGFTAPLVCVRVPVSLMVLVAAMVPTPAESAGAWWANTGHEQARRSRRSATLVRPTPSSSHGRLLARRAGNVIVEAFARGERAQSETVFADPWPLESWPDVPTKFVLCRDDHFFPAEFQRRVVADRLGITPDEMDGGHLPALARPKELAERLMTYADERQPS